MSYASQRFPPNNINTKKQVVTHIITVVYRIPTIE